MTTACNVAHMPHTTFDLQAKQNSGPLALFPLIYGESVTTQTNALATGDGCITKYVAPQAERTCQQTEPVNWRKRRIWRRSGPRRAIYMVRQPVSPRSEERRKNYNMFEMFGMTVRFRGEATLSTKGACEFEMEVVAPRHGFEPRFTAPKAAVLPLDDRGSLGGNDSTSVAFTRRSEATR